MSHSPVQPTATAPSCGPDARDGSVARCFRRRLPRRQTTSRSAIPMPPADHPQPDSTARLPQVGPQLRSPRRSDHRPAAARPELRGATTADMTNPQETELAQRRQFTRSTPNDGASR